MPDFDTIYVASDHAGFALKAEIVKFLKSRTKVEDLGTESEESCDYPLFAQKVALQIQKNSQSLGILICGTGIGMSIAANKFSGIRAACVSEARSAQMAREHNNANILCFGARIVTSDTAKQCVLSFLESSFDKNSPRHQRRIDEITSFEK